MATGTFDLQVVRYTGDGTSNRTITTTFALNTGVVAVWISGKDGVDCFRHNGAGCTGTSIIGSSTIQTTTGIMSFGATGFAVTDGNITGNHYANGTGVKYSAIVLRDSTSDNRYMRVGTYTGSAAADNRTVTISGTSFPYTHLWVLGNGGKWAYRSTDFSGDAAVTLEAQAVTSVIADLIQSMTTTAFQVGTLLNTDSREYDYVALNADSYFDTFNIFRSFKGNGSASPPTVISNMPVPAYAEVRRFSTVAGKGYWRGLDHTGVTSESNGGVAEATQAIVAFGTNSVSIGTTPGPAGSDFYGYVFAASGQVGIATTPTITQVDGWRINRLDFKPSREEHQ